MTGRSKVIVIDLIHQGEKIFILYVLVLFVRGETRKAKVSHVLVLSLNCAVSHLAGVVHVGVVAVARVLLVAVEPVIVRLVQEVPGAARQPRHRVRVLLVHHSQHGQNKPIFFLIG